MCRAGLSASAELVAVLSTDNLTLEIRTPLRTSVTHAETDD